MTAMSATLPTSEAAAARTRVWIEYAVEGDLRFLSHHDEIRALTRAILRARWPLAYSGGFNPAPRLSIPLPRAVGVAAAAQRAVVELTPADQFDALADSLRQSLPDGLRLLDVIAAPAGAKPHPLAVEYTAELTPEECRAAAAHADALLAAPSRVVARRDRDGRERGDVDIRPSVEELVVADGALRFRIGLHSGAIARPHEILAELGFVPSASIHRLRRTAVTWDTSHAARQSPPASTQIEESELASEEDNQEDRQEGGTEEDAAPREER